MSEEAVDEGICGRMRGNFFAFEQEAGEGLRFDCGEFAFELFAELKFTEEGQRRSEQPRDVVARALITASEIAKKSCEFCHFVLDILFLLRRNESPNTNPARGEHGVCGAEGTESAGMTARSRHGGELAVGGTEGTGSAGRRARSLRGGELAVGMVDGTESAGRRACGRRG